VIEATWQILAIFRKEGTTRDYVPNSHLDCRYRADCFSHEAGEARWHIPKMHCARRRVHFASESYCGGCVVTHDLVNTSENLESLFEAKERGVTSIQEFFANRERDI